MGVAEDDEGRRREPTSESVGSPASRSGVVHHRDPHPVEVDDELFGQLDQRVVVVAAHGVHGRELAQFLEELDSDHVAGVQHDIRATHRREHRVVEATTAAVEKVRVGEQHGTTHDRTPTVSAASASRVPSGCSGPRVLSRAVWCSNSEFNSAPSTITKAERYSQNSMITMDAKDP